MNVRALATYTQREGEYWQQHAETLRATAVYGSEMPMEGDFAPVFREGLGKLPEGAAALVTAHQGAGAALAQYAVQLEAAKRESQIALQQGIQAKEMGAQATRAYDQAIAQMNALPKVVPPEQYPFVLQQYEMLQAEANQAMQAINQARMEWEAAQRSALMAGDQAKQAEAVCAQKVRDVLPKNVQPAASGGGAPVAAGGGERPDGGLDARGLPHDLNEEDVHEIVPFADKAAARQGLEGDLQPVANRFYRGATSKSRDFQLINLADGNLRMQYFSPANNPGYGKLYVQTIDPSGRIVTEFKDTLGPGGLIERKWVHGEPS
ncbi:MAG TPA: hypothetical protein VE442_04125 [Jatrophihabitans sp.]|nr:hypothetical protein [Jatrophihabitans sp.]